MTIRSAQEVEMGKSDNGSGEKCLGIPGQHGGLNGSFGIFQNRSLRRLDILREDISCLIHEIRTPLTAVISAAELLKGHQNSVKPPVFLVEVIEQEARRIKSLLEDFFDAYHRDSGTWLSKTIFSVVEISDLLQETADRFRNIAPKYLLRVEVLPDLPPVRVDRGKISLVLRNLVANAVKYSPDGGTVVVSAARDGNRIVICVRDEGIGIPEESLQRVFERSYRVGRPEGSAMRGSGLGLAIVRRIVESHGGEVRVESRPGQGSEFFFSLPMFHDTSIRIEEKEEKELP
jgi:two-component system phosphate regulon sensor histidine kinase PhoR